MIVIIPASALSVRGDLKREKRSETHVLHLQVGVPAVDILSGSLYTAVRVRAYMFKNSIVLLSL